MYQVALFGQVTYLINVLHPRPCSTSPHFFLAHILSHPMTTTTFVTSCPPSPPALSYQRDLPTAHPLLVYLVFCRQHDSQRNIFTQILKNAWGGCGWWQDVSHREVTQKLPGTEVIPPPNAYLGYSKLLKPSGWSGWSWAGASDEKTWPRALRNSPLGPAVSPIKPL